MILLRVLEEGRFSVGEAFFTAHVTCSGTGSSDLEKTRVIFSRLALYKSHGSAFDLATV